MCLKFELIDSKNRHIIQSFYCGNASIERYLHQNAYYETISFHANTSLAFQNNDLIGFFTLKYSKLELFTTQNIHELLIQLEEYINQYPYEIKHDPSDNEGTYLLSFPALELKWFAVHSKKQKQGIEKQILHHIIEIALKTNVRFIQVDALVESEQWYLNNHFETLIEVPFRNIQKNTTCKRLYMDLYDDAIIEQFFDE